MEKLNWNDLEELTEAATRFKGKVDVLSIDPPFNTHTGFLTMEEEGDRHQIWADYMRERLALVNEMLTDEAFIFIAIDDNEFAQLKLLCDEVFGEDCFKKLIETYPRPHHWRIGTREGRCFHQYILCYGKDESLFFEPTVKGRQDRVMDLLLEEQKVANEKAVVVKASVCY